MKSPQRKKHVAVASEQQIFASLQPYIDGCLRRATLGKSSLGKAGVLGKATVLSLLDAIVTRRCIELPVRCPALFRATDLFVDSERYMVCGITLEAFPRRRYDRVPGVGCNTVIMSKTVAWIHQVKHFGRLLQVRYAWRRLPLAENERQRRWFGNSKDHDARC